MSSIPNRPPGKLTGEIIRLSVADGWHEAKLEWQLQKVFYSGMGRCLCGHLITEQHLVRNVLNGNTAVVGCCCVKRLGGQSGRILAAVKRIMADVEAALNAEAIDLAYEQGWIDDREKEFYLDTLPTCGKVRKWGLSERQLAWRVSINRKIAAHMAEGREVGHA